MMELLSKNEVQRNRQLIVDMLSGMPPEAFELNTFLREYVGPMDIDIQVEGNGNRDSAIAKKLNGYWLTLRRSVRVQPQDEPKEAVALDGCGTVGCFAGWSWTHPAYQDWCREHDLVVSYTGNLGLWLGLPHPSGRGLFDGRHHDRLSQKQEVLQRLRAMNLQPVVLPTPKRVLEHGKAGYGMPPAEVVCAPLPHRKPCKKAKAEHNLR